MVTQKKKIIFSSIILFIVIIIIGYWAIYNYVFKNKQTVYIPKSLTTNLYSTKESQYYLDPKLSVLHVYSIDKESSPFYDDPAIFNEKKKKLLDYLNEFDIKEIHSIKFLDTSKQRKIISVNIFSPYENMVSIHFINQSVFRIIIFKGDGTGTNPAINKTYLIKNGYIDYNYLEDILKD